MRTDFTPVAAVIAVPHDGGGVRFMGYQEQIDFDAKNAEYIWKLLEYGNGFNNLRQIAELAQLPVEGITAVAEYLHELGLIIDVRDEYQSFHRLSSLPTPFSFQAMPDTATEKARFFPRFSGRSLCPRQLKAVCSEAFFGVPSGRPLSRLLHAYLLIEKPQNGLEAGCYRCGSGEEWLQRCSWQVDLRQLRYCFNDEGMPFNSAVQLVITADFGGLNGPSTNRDYRLILIETGQLVARIKHACGNNAVRVLEVAWFQDEPLKQELGLTSTEIQPVAVLALGTFDEGSREPYFDKPRLIENLVADESAVEQFYVRTFGEHGSFFGATALYRDGNSCLQFAGATSPSYTDAVFKATVEAYERWCSGQVRTDYIGTAKGLDRYPSTAWLNPYTVFPLTKTQIKEAGLVEFAEDLPLHWVLGKTSQGKDIYLPVDIVYYGFPSHDVQIYFGHSSGIAAYTDFVGAKKRALVELIERDALMRNWYAEDSPNQLVGLALPYHAFRRISHWRSFNRQMYILELPSEYGRVVEAIIVGHEYPYFVSGAAATIDDDIEIVINKAIEEAEYNLLLALEMDENKPPVLSEVWTPVDHGRLYHYKKYAKRLSWLWSGRRVEHFRTVQNRSLEDLERELEVITVDLSEPDADFKVVRVFSPRLVQINFGFYTAHYTYPFLKVNPKALKLPHYFA